MGSWTRRSKGEVGVGLKKNSRLTEKNLDLYVLRKAKVIVQGNFFLRKLGLTMVLSLLNLQPIAL